MTTISARVLVANAWIGAMVTAARSGRGCREGQHDLHRGAGILAALDAHFATTLTGEAKHLGEAETCTFALRLGGEERLARFKPDAPVGADGTASGSA